MKVRKILRMRIYEFEKEKKKERKRGGSELSSLSKEIVPIKCKAAPRLSVKMITVFWRFLARRT
jgi:hypothetical protein